MAAAAAAAHNRPDQYGVLAADDVQPERHVGVLLADDDPLDGLLEHDVGELVEGAERADHLLPVAQQHQNFLCAAAAVERQW